mmetsp:Transcript_13508/g.29360  ORF Transcript_13508/g.29360 Transcript_13508/m.29360 type:complete len:103 (+) Transcript_13508:76-384(+)|eukprot:CAMPEP_0172297528 /NCGR_PEP_ID=MMETSP1058-20130122/516_1 /TAXON_ID=83371 /ORGANISM="Detonula confervacea, Strain CCMP 353" /LENGTH=102 /DNA_ID=CAMNT_0013006693 /DNA_START=26 /DNA_END=334 /DNA_ORIENTATION=-
MNRLFATIVAVIAMATVPSASALLLSPLLLRANPWGITGRNINTSSRSKTVKTPPTISHVDTSSLARTDFGRGDDLMRYKHELLSDIYEKSMSRGFEGNQGH